MSIEDQVRAIVEHIIDECIRDNGGTEEAVAALMRLVEPCEVPKTELTVQKIADRLIEKVRSIDE